MNKIFSLLNRELNLRILENGLFEGDRSWIFNDVVSSFNRMYFIQSGQAYLEDTTTRHEFIPGKVYLIPAGKSYNYVCTDQIHKFYLHFSLEFLPGVDIFHGLDHYLCTDYTPELLKEIIDLAGENTLASLLKCKAIFNNIASGFMLLANQYEEYHLNYHNYGKQKEVLQYIHSHLDANLRIAQIADFFHVPTYTVSREFKQDTGTLLKEQIEKMLLSRCKYELLNTDLSIQEIAYKYSFCDAYYFSRFFRKYEQMPPSEYRKSHTFSGCFHT